MFNILLFFVNFQQSLVPVQVLHSIHRASTPATVILTVLEMRNAVQIHVGLNLVLVQEALGEEHAPSKIHCFTSEYINILFS